MRPDKCGVIFQLEAAIHYDPHRGLITVKGGTLAEIGKGPKLWSGNCITDHAYKNPPEVITNFIYWEVKQKGTVALTYYEHGSRNIRMFTHKSVTITEKGYLDVLEIKNGEEMSRVDEFKRSHQPSLADQLTDDEVLYAYRTALSLYRKPTGDREFDSFIEGALVGAHDDLAKRGLSRDSDDNTTPHFE